MSEKKHAIPPTALTLLVVGLLVAWTAVLLYRTIYPGKSEYQERLEATVAFMVGRKAADLDEAERILSEADALLREPFVDQREYHLIKAWLVEYHDGKPTQDQKNALIAKKRKSREVRLEIKSSECCPDSCAFFCILISARSNPASTLPDSGDIPQKEMVLPSGRA